MYKIVGVNAGNQCNSAQRASRRQPPSECNWLTLRANLDTLPGWRRAKPVRTCIDNSETLAGSGHTYPSPAYLSENSADLLAKMRSRRQTVFYCFLYLIPIGFLCTILHTGRCRIGFWGDRRHWCDLCRHENRLAELFRVTRIAEMVSQPPAYLPSD